MENNWKKAFKIPLKEHWGVWVCVCVCVCGGGGGGGVGGMGGYKLDYQYWIQSCVSGPQS